MTPKRDPRMDTAVKQALADLLDQEIADPRVRFVTITDVRVTPDHEHATVYYTSLDADVLTPDPRRGGDDVAGADEAAAGLRSAAPRLQGLLARRLRMRNTPKLRFETDPVADTARRVDELLHRVRAEDDASTESDR